MLDPQILEKAVALRHELHMHPELSMQEVWTKQRLMDFLKENTSLEINDRGQWFYAAYRGGGDKPGIAYRADFDALPINETTDLPWKSKIPGVSHKCGHDGHSASLCAFALDVDKQKPPYNIFFTFQPGEETGEGGEEASKVILEETITESYAHHNYPEVPFKAITCRTGVSECASQGMKITFEGQHSHASEPENGRNPIWAIADVCHALPIITDCLPHKGLVLSTVVHAKVGTPDFGINPGDGLLCLTNRAEFEEELRQFEEAIRILAQSAAEKYHLEVSFAYQDGYPETRNHLEQFNKVKKAAENLGLQFIINKDPTRGSEDYGWFTKRAPGCFFGLGAGEDLPSIHTPDYDYNDELIPVTTDIYWELLKQH
jgi:amidohydrolase